jgi:hypothetical protein
LADEEGTIDPEAEEEMEFLNELYDEEFDEAVYELISEANELFDVFVGEKQRGEPFIQLLGGREVDIWFDGIERRISTDYKYGLT